MSKGKQAARSANRRAGQAESDATNWRHRSLVAEAEARGYKRTAALLEHQLEATTAELRRALEGVPDEVVRLNLIIEKERATIAEQREFLETASLYCLTLMRRANTFDEVMPAGLDDQAAVAAALGFPSVQKLVGKIFGVKAVPRQQRDGHHPPDPSRRSWR